MQWILIGIFVADSTFFFRILEIHSNEMGCLMAQEEVNISLGKTGDNYGLVCIKTNAIEGNQS